MKSLLIVVLLGLSACQRSREPEAGKPEPASDSDAADVPPTATAAPAQNPPGAGAAARTTFAFEMDETGGPPSGFVFGRTGRGRPGRWSVQSDRTAKSPPNLLAQLDADATSFRFPLAVTAEQHPANVRVSVACKMVSGRVDQACGLVLRYRDEDNYLITRANALEDNVRLYRVERGKREELASHDGRIEPNVWHDYRFEARADELRVWWNGTLLIEHRDGTFVGAGSVGVWTKADSVTYFDDLVVETL